MKFKVMRLEWYAQFGIYDMWLNSYEDSQAHYEYELQAKKKEGRSYDGPLSYIEPCEDMPFPPREGIQYCVRIHRKPESYYYRYYQCYCYQLGKWWKFKKEQTIFTDLYVPQIMSHYDWLKLKSQRNRVTRYLSKKAMNDYKYYCQMEQFKNIRTSMGKSFLRIR